MKRLPELDDAVQNLSEELDLRLIVLDKSMRVAAYSIHESPTDRSRLSHVLAHSDAWTSPPDELQATKLLDSRNRTIGYVLAPLPPRAGRQLAELMEALQQQTADRSRRAQELTKRVIVGDAPTQALIDERLLSHSTAYSAVALGVDPRSATPLDHEKTARAVDTTLDFVRATSTATVVGTVLADHLGVLIFPRPVVLPRLTRILETRELSPVRAGIGPLVPLDELHQSLDKARLTWRVSWLSPQNYEAVTSWEDCGLDATLARLPLEDFTVNDLPPAASSLLSTGLASELLTTVESYLDCGGDAQHTAQKLRIHRSTLYYRLDKIRPLLPGELSDGRLRLELHTGLRMARLAGLI